MNTLTQTPVSTCQFAALEPSWAGIHSEPQLRGLFILGALFNRAIYVHDTQLLDNPHLLHAFNIRHDKEHSLYNHVATFVANNLLRVAIRDATYLPATDKLIPCDSIVDVYQSWITQDMKDAWVAPADIDRATYVSHLAEITRSANPIRYPYMDIKAEFMRRARQGLIGTENKAHFHHYQSLPASVRNQYEKILARDWFSHSDIFDLLTKSNLRLQHPFVQAHGLFDEAAYATWNRSRLLGCDSQRWSSEDTVTRKRNNTQVRFADIHANLESYAIRTIDGVGISLLATLTPHEVMELRAAGDGVFRLTEFLDEMPSLDNIAELQENYLDALSVYWERICNFLRRSRPSMTQEHTRIGIFTRGQMPTVAKMAGRVASFSVSLGLDLLSLPFSSIRKLDPAQRQEVVDRLSFRFLFHSDTAALKRLRHTVPDRTWLAREMLTAKSEEVHA